MNKDQIFKNEDLEIRIYNWVLAQQEAELAVSTIDVVDTALLIEREFCNGYYCKLHDWVYQFMKRRNLAVRTRTHKIQITNAAMQDVKDVENLNLLE